MQLDGKAAVITGSSAGIGRATAIALAEKGCSVLINYRQSRDDAEQAAHEALSHGVRAVTFQADVADDSACRAMMAAAVAAFGRLDILVNNAATTRFIAHGDLEGVAEQDWERIIAVNLRGPFQCARAAQAPMLAAGGGVIINVASVAGILGVGSSIPYAASKAALINLTITLAKALAPSIRVNAVAPGFVTGRWLELGLGAAYTSVKQQIESRVPLHKVCEPHDVAAAILSLITGSELITGQTLVCDGGMTIAAS